MDKQIVNKEIFGKRFSEVLEDSTETTYTIADKLSLTPSTISRYTNGLMAPKITTLYALASLFRVNPLWLMGYDEPKQVSDDSAFLSGRSILPIPNIADDYVSFPVIGEVAAGYGSPALEDWEGETIDIPLSMLKGRKREEFFVLKVKGDSMYPMYQDGDKVLVLKQETMNYSGQIGVVIYDGMLGTLKKVEYVMGEDWMRLVPINPSYPPIKIENEELEQCRVLGIPKMLIREIEE